MFKPKPQVELKKWVVLDHKTSEVLATHDDLWELQKLTPEPGQGFITLRDSVPFFQGK